VIVTAGRKTVATTVRVDRHIVPTAALGTFLVV